ncbi:MAG: extracellular solute-binding protein [Oscillospiraceae bacterium]|nr:extracellular solute-binding protein [Oscillospiraceae bacterium]
MGNIKRICVFLALTAMLLAFASCGEKKSEPVAQNEKTENDSGDPDSENDEKPNAESQKEEREKEEKEMLAGILPEDFGGYTFHFISRRENSPEWDIWGNRDIYAGEETGETINDAVYRRNRYIEDAYNCNIEEFQSFSMVNDLRKTIKSGDDEYDVALPPLNQGINLAADGLLLNLGNVGAMNLENKWWDQNANKSLSIGGKLYYTSGDMLILNNDSTGAFVFSKQLIQEHQFDIPYQLVKEGKWTFDVFYSQVKQVSADINGDGKMDRNDKYGFMQYRDVLHCLFHGAGGNFGEKDGNDFPYFTLDSEKSIMILEKVFEIMNDPANTYRLHMTYNEGVTNAFVLGQSMFEENRVLYYWIRLRDIEPLRSMEADFGILPIPKWDESQTDYFCTVNFHVSTCITIPISSGNPERTGLFLEAFNCKSKYALQPAYYDIALNGKYVRDEESSEMLDIIFANRVYDIGLIGDFGGMRGLIDTMVDKDDRNFISQIEKSKPKVEKDIEKKIEKITDLD